MKNLCSLLLFILLLVSLPVQAEMKAGAHQNHAEILGAVTAFLKAQTHDLPGTVAIKVDDIDQRVVRSACSRLEAFLPTGSQLLGNGMVGVRCPGKNGWSLFVQVHVTVSVDVLITNKPLPQGHVLLAEDISSMKAEVSQTGILIDPAQAIGKILQTGVSAGQVLKQDMLRAPYVVKQGQTVKLQVEGTGFSILSEGLAMGNAAEGQSVQVKSTSGQMVSGMARRGGIVDVRP